MKFFYLRCPVILFWCIKHFISYTNPYNPLLILILDGLKPPVNTVSISEANNRGREKDVWEQEKENADCWDVCKH